MCQDMEPEDGVFAGKAEFMLVFASSALCPFVTPDFDYNLMTVWLSDWDDQSSVHWR